MPYDTSASAGQTNGTSLGGADIYRTRAERRPAVTLDAAPPSRHPKPAKIFGAVNRYADVYTLGMKLNELLDRKTKETYSLVYADANVPTR